MNHSFNVEFATKYGIKEALIIHYLYEQDSFLVVKELLKYFTYFSESTIRNCLSELIKLDVVELRYSNCYKLTNNFVLNCYKEVIKNDNI
jgi:hypothetical protein